MVARPVAHQGPTAAEDSIECEPMILTLLTILCVAGVAWANGANDVSKGVATLVGSRLASYRRGLSWGTAWTVAGALAALAFTSALVATFSTGLVAGSFSQSSLFPLSVAAGAFAWVLIASRTGLPVSTTHSLAGAIVGTAIAAAGVRGVEWTLVIRVGGGAAGAQSDRGWGACLSGACGGEPSPECGGTILRLRCRAPLDFITRLGIRGKRRVADRLSAAGSRGRDIGLFRGGRTYRCAPHRRGPLADQRPSELCARPE